MDNIKEANIRCVNCPHEDVGQYAECNSTDLHKQINELTRKLEFKQKDFKRAMGDFGEANAEIGTLEDKLKDKNIEIDNIQSEKQIMIEALDKIANNKLLHDTCTGSCELKHIDTSLNCYECIAKQALGGINR